MDNWAHEVCLPHPKGPCWAISVAEGPQPFPVQSRFRRHPTPEKNHLSVAGPGFSKAGAGKDGAGKVKKTIGFLTFWRKTSVARKQFGTL